jgi:hypothetical protein
LTQQTTCTVTQVQAGIISGGVVSSTPLRLSGLRTELANAPCNGIGSVTNNVDFTGNLVLVTANTKRCKPGTIDKTTGVARLEWIDQGDTIIGANGTLTGTGTAGSVGNQTTNTYAVVLNTSDPVIQDVSGACSTPNADNYTVTRTAQVSRTTHGALDLAYNNAITVAGYGSTIPEPGTLSLIGLGLAGLGWMGMKRARKARASAV